MMPFQNQMLKMMFGDFIGKWIERGKIAWNYIKMIRQLISDLCLVLFLWIILTAIKSLIMSYI